MDKITRMLFLYSALIKGEKVNKTVFCFENDCSPRSFDRDIEDVRLYLSEAFLSSELIYDRKSNSYYIDGVRHQELETMEYLFIERLLNDTAVLRKDELEILMSHILSNTRTEQSLSDFKNRLCSSYESPIHNKALLKIHGDLALIIRQKKCIRIRYIKGNGEEIERDIIPCAVKYDLGYLYMIGFRYNKNDKYPAYYRLDRIYSFEELRKQTFDEQKKVEDYLNNYLNGITQMYGGKYISITLKCNKEYYPYLYDKFRNAKISEENENSFIVKIDAFEDGFVKWLISQSQAMITIMEPESTKNKLVEEAEKIIKKYGGAY